jgi:hypothetical protein
MKLIRLIPIAAVLLSLGCVAFAQSHTAKPTDQAAPTEAQKSFAAIKTFAGEWEGPVAVPDMPEMGNGTSLHVTLRVTSRGNAVVHELQEANTPLDATKYDHPVTMMYVEGDKLNLVHYCDAGNRPHMTGKLLPDGKSVEFTLVDVSGSTGPGHMHHAVFTYIDADHHTEDWTFIMPGDKTLHAHMDLRRAK